MKINKLIKPINEGYVVKSKNKSLSERYYTCPECHNRTLGEVSENDDLYICDECGAEGRGYETFEGNIAFYDDVDESKNQKDPQQVEEKVKNLVAIYGEVRAVEKIIDGYFRDEDENAPEYLLSIYDSYNFGYVPEDKLDALYDDVSDYVASRIDVLSDTVPAEVLNPFLDAPYTDMDESAPINETYWIDNKEVMDEVDRLVRELQADGWMFRDDRYTGSKYYVIFQRRGDNGAEFCAIKYSHTHTPEVVELSYKQIVGDVPMDSFDGMRRKLGKILLPQNESKSIKEGVYDRNEDIVAALEKTPYTSFVVDEKEYIKIQGKWRTTSRRAHSDYIEIKSFLNKKLGASNFDLVYEGNDTRDDGKEVSCSLRLELKNSLKEESKSWGGHKHPEQDKIEKALMAINGTTKVEFDYRPDDGVYKVPENHLIILPFCRDDKVFGDGSEYFKNRKKWRDSVLAKLRQLGWTQEDPMEDNDTYLYLVMKKRPKMNEGGPEYTMTPEVTKVLQEIARLYKFFDYKKDVAKVKFRSDVIRQLQIFCKWYLEEANSTKPDTRELKNFAIQIANIVRTRNVVTESKSIKTLGAKAKKLNESDDVQYGVHSFSQDAIIFRGTEEECGRYIDSHKELWDDAEVYRMEPNDLHYKMMNEAVDYKVKFFQVFEAPKSPKENGKMIGQRGTLDDANAFGKEKVGEGNYIIKAVCDDGQTRPIDNDTKSDAFKMVNEDTVVPSSYEFDDDVDDLTYYYDDELFKDNLENSPYTEIASKQVVDADGFMTDYTMYMNINTGEYVFVFGDKDVYSPDDGYFDWECETEAEARAWFDNYSGFDDDIDESSDHMRITEEDSGSASTSETPSNSSPAPTNNNKKNNTTEESPIVAKKSDGSYLIPASNGDGYVAFNRSDVCMGNISAANENEAKGKFNANKFDEKLQRNSK